MDERRAGATPDWPLEPNHDVPMILTWGEASALIHAAHEWRRREPADPEAERAVEASRTVLLAVERVRFQWSQDVARDQRVAAQAAPACTRCVFWTRYEEPAFELRTGGLGTAAVVPVAGAATKHGTCRRFPPSAIGWATTDEHDSCGEFRAKEGGGDA